MPAWHPCRLCIGCWGSPSSQSLQQTNPLRCSKHTRGALSPTKNHRPVGMPPSPPSLSPLRLEAPQGGSRNKEEASGCPWAQDQGWRHLVTTLTHVSSAFTPQAVARCGTTSPAGQPPLGARWLSWPVPSSLSSSPPFKVRTSG